MSIPGSANPLLLVSAAAAGGYGISRSLRFNSSDSAYLSRTPSTAGNRKTWTWAGWVKASRLGTYRGIFEGYTGSPAAANRTSLQLANADQIDVLFDNTSSGRLTTTQVFRDPSAWYHIVFACDTTQATASNRFKIYINGSQVTTFAAATYPSQNYDTGINTTQAHYMGRVVDPLYADFYLADIHFIDGQALPPTSFTEVSATTGRLEPKAYSGPTPTGNSFWLPFSDNSAATATTLGKDNFNLGNNWTPNNLSVTAGAGNDSLVDTPVSGSTVDTGLGGQVTGNYCTLNPLVNAAYNIYSNGNLECAFPAATTGATAVGTIAVSSGKWYWELRRNDISAGILAGIARIDTNTINLIGSNAISYAYKDSNGNKINNGTSTAYGATWNAANIIGVALDLDAGTLVFYKDNVSQGTAFSGLSGTFYPAFSEDSAGGGSGVEVNFGQRPFAYTAPSGFKALCDTNLPSPQVAKPSTVMDVKLYTGNGSTQTISGLGFSPDLVWVKIRSNLGRLTVEDTVRGATKNLFTSETYAEETDTNSITAFTSDGFSLGNNTTGSSNVNVNSSTYAAWCWDAGSTTVTDNTGSIQSTRRTNASAGVSVVTYTGNGTSGATIGHGLGVTPGLMIVKSRDTQSLNNNWCIYHSSLGNTKALEFSTSSAFGPEAGFWNNTSPTSTVLSVGNYQVVNTPAKNYVAYCFAPVAGYSAFGSYTGTTSQPFVYLGFRPKLVMIKFASGGANTSYTSWYMSDSVRDTDNPQSGTGVLWANRSDAEGKRGDGTTGGSFLDVDFLSNGFRVLDTTNVAELNFSGATYVYAAWAESPFAYSRAR